MKTLLSILKALAVAALFTWIGVTLLGCGPPQTLDDCIRTGNVVKAYRLLDCTREPGCAITARQLRYLRATRNEYSQCFTEHFP